MLKSRRPLPDIGELVVGTVAEVHEYGAYLTLDEYGGHKALLPWSEVASRSVRSIDEVVRPGQKVVVKVIRVYKGKGHVDVSLKRVMEGERRRKMMQYKRYVKASTLITTLARKIGKSVDEAYEEVIWRLEDTYGDPLAGLERAVLEGEKALKAAGVPEEWAKHLVELAKTHVEVKTVRVLGILTLKSTAGDGVERIKTVLESARKAAEKPKVKLRLYTVGTPRYRVELEGHDYKTLEETLKSLIEEAENKARKLGVEMKFERIKE